MKELFDIENLTQFEFGAIVLTVLVAGLIFGCLLAYGLLNRKSSPKTVAAEKAEKEFEEYKEKVDEHFTQTSEMFKDVTTQYKKLYDHMAVGAIALGNADTIAMPRLEMKDSTQENEIAAEPEIEQAEQGVEQEPIISEALEQDISAKNTALAESEDEIVDAQEQAQQESKTS